MAPHCPLDKAPTQPGIQVPSDLALWLFQPYFWALPSHRFYPSQANLLSLSSAAPSLCPPLSLFPAQGRKRELKRACGEKFGEDGNSSNTQRGWLTKCHTWKVWEQEQKAGDKEAKAEVVLAWPHGLATYSKRQCRSLDVSLPAQPRAASGPSVKDGVESTWKLAVRQISAGFSYPLGSPVAFLVI